MPGADSVRNLSRRIYDITGELNSEKRKFDSEVEDIDYWWKGKPPEAFKQNYIDKTYVYNKTINGLKAMQQKVYSLANSVDKADEERRLQHMIT